MRDKITDIHSMEVELRKAILSQWINIAAAGILTVGVVACFFIPKLRDWTIVTPGILLVLMLLRRARVIKQFAQELEQEKEQELARLNQEALAQPGIWPPAPRDPAI